MKNWICFPNDSVYPSLSPALPSSLHTATPPPFQTTHSIHLIHPRTPHDKADRIGKSKTRIRLCENNMFTVIIICIPTINSREKRYS